MNVFSATGGPARGALLATLGLVTVSCANPAPVLKDERGAAAPAPGAPDVSLVFTSDVRGYVGPCGCSENMRGGIARSAAVIDAIRAEGHPTLLIEAGDLLFGHPTLPEEAVPQQERKAQALAQALLAMRVDLKADGPLDDARGAAFRESLKLPELKSGDYRVLKAGQVKVGVIAAFDASAVATLAGRARHDGATFVVALFARSFKDASALAHSAQLHDVDLIVPSHAASEADGEESHLLRGDVAVAQLQSKGRSLLRVDLWAGAGDRFALLHGQVEQERELSALDGRIELMRAQVNLPGLAEELKALKQQKLAELVDRRAAVAAQPPTVAKGQRGYTARFIPIESSLPESPAIKALVTAYDRDVGLINLRWAKEHGKDCAAPPAGTAKYSGNASCFDCHEKAFAVWRTSKHAHGYQTLEKVGKNHHLDCIGCHVTGWQKPGGTCRIDRTSGFEAVGCESCHGPGSLHVEDPGDDNIGKGNEAKVCVSCHDPENSPTFAFETYVQQIIGPGHGKAP